MGKQLNSGLILSFGRIWKHAGIAGPATRCAGSLGTRRREGVAIANEAQGFSNLPHNLTTLSYERLHSSEKRILFSLLKIPRKASVQSGKNIKLLCTSCTWAMDFARDANVAIKVTERKISNTFSSRRRRTRTHALTTLPPPLRRRTSKGTPTYFAPV